MQRYAVRIAAAVLALILILGAGCAKTEAPWAETIRTEEPEAVSGPEEEPEEALPDETEKNETEKTEETEMEDRSVTEAGPAAPEPEAEEPPSAAKDSPRLLFEDDFDGTDLDGSKWERCPEWERGGGACVWDDDYSWLDGNGHLVLRAAYDDDEAQIHSGAVRTAGRFYGGFGYYEASICFPKAPGTWGAFWIMAGDLNAASAKDGLEIDIIESINNESGLCNHALHWNYGDLHSLSSGQMKKAIYDGQFHTFGLERTEEGYTFYIDGKRTWRAMKNQCEPCIAEGYMKLTVEAAEWAGAGTLDSIGALPADMIVDYVRVYSEKP